MTQPDEKHVATKHTMWRVGDAPLPCMQPYGESITDQYPIYKDFYFIETPDGPRHVRNGDVIATDISGEHYVDGLASHLVETTPGL
jgi:hypothetical protein